jgi:DNA-binding winged helix-turn-helix (wHTH) protein/Tol biopolymer transport system component
MATSNGDRSNIYFGDYELDLRLGVLRKNGIRLRCQEQPLQVLAVLVESPGELVTREELRRRVWTHDTFVDFDHALNTAVKKIRATLNDDADAPRYIETVPRRGYRFVATLERRTPAVAPTPRPPAVHSTRNRWFVILGTLMAVHIAALVWLLANWKRSEASSVPDFQRLTFDQPHLGNARFTADGASVVYASGGKSHGGDIYLENLGTSNSQSLHLPETELLAISRQGELAILGKGQKPMIEVPFRMNSGTLAQVSLGGSAPRELQHDVEGADWSPDGRLAVVRRVGHHSRLEFPVGKVLYETAGCIDSPRFSPSGDSIAFIDHPVIPDDRGSVDVVDLKGNTKTLSEIFESVRGLAWYPHSNEVWFAAARSGVSRKLYAVSLSGRERRVLSVAGGLSLRDVAPDGRVLLTRDNERLGIQFMGPGDKDVRDLSWKDWSIAMDISHDGKEILFGEEGENSGSSYQVGLRPTDGSPPVILGQGIAQSLSPDGKWALSILPPPENQIVLLPTGVGVSKLLGRGNIERYEFVGARWFPDSRQIVFAGYEANHGSRCYAQSIEGGLPRAFTPDGMVFCSVSPSGIALGLTEDGRILLFSSLSSGKPDREFKLGPEETPSGWSPDGRSLYLADMEKDPLVISRLDISSGVRQPWKQIATPPLPGNSAMRMHDVVMTPDGQSYAFTYTLHASDLYLVQGLR